MSYQVLARKWRPRSFSEMAGQEHVLRALINALDNDRLHHAYLFTGTRGVGKTTIARILAKCLNCEEGVSSTPCGKCGACTEIAAGRFIDLIEVDAASRTKVEDTRELLDNVQYMPSHGRFKVYLIDEVHMLSTHSFNALLKTLEEPPAHVKFLLATTDPQKLPVTILSRCLQFNLKNLSPERIVEHLKFVLGEEKIPFEESALWALGRVADGSMRDALSLTDQAIAHGGGKISEAELSTMLGSIDRSWIIAICNALCDGDSAQMLAQVALLAEHAPDFSAALNEMLSVWHRVAIAQVVPEAMDNSLGDQQAIINLAARLGREEVQLYYQICLLGKRDLPLAADPRTGFEMVMLRLLAFQPLPEVGLNPPPAAERVAPAVEPVAPDKVAEAVKKSEALDQKASELPTDPALEMTRNPVEHGKVEPDNEEPSNKKPDNTKFGDLGSGEIGAEPAPVNEIPAESVAKSSASFCQIDEVAQQQTSAPDEIFTGGILDGVAIEPPAPPAQEYPAQTSLKYSLKALDNSHWVTLCPELPIGGLLGTIASNSVLERNDDAGLIFRLEKGHDAVYESSHQQRLADALTEYFQQPVALEILVGEVSAETPYLYRLRKRAERQALAVQNLRDDPVAQALAERFGATLLEGTVVPIDE